MKLVLVAALVLRLVGDLATPLLPGAFRFDADAPVEVSWPRPAPQAAPGVGPARPERPSDAAAAPVGVAVVRPAPRPTAPALVRGAMPPRESVPLSSPDDD
jgi:hypothetical protein